MIYYKNDGIIQKTISENLEDSIIPQILDVLKQFYEECSGCKISDYIEFNPISENVKNLIDSFDNSINDDFIQNLKITFNKFFGNSLGQLLLAKPFIVNDKEGQTRIAYNEREWRKSFWELNYIPEFFPNGERNEEFIKIRSKPKPHFTEDYILKFNINDIDTIIVKNFHEEQEIKNYIKNELNMIDYACKISVLSELKEA